ncbi:MULTISPECIES: hypothetical protein [Ralstonia solanacearum species complex]|uniref:Uncharacterized protein n=2 Tax=root TaxID=1 RepID=A0A1W5LU35_9VIRU|nr:hypothetical protein [Ralstonia solanacearum]YP_009786101.1 hypothetical protein [Ralstonia phage Rs551]ALF87512.1 hypothetical protein RSUY_11430 [Ralstonia solanacearum]ANO57662.1 hypothetical protein [Ralstonia phage Rs551]ATI27030.1 hypothetical protein CCY86_05700 [Ralstonia solanacearum]EAP73623.1 Hypothetical Protein RRSL_03348 [Ralstonia solanacearum UW551]KEI33611.1 hypothetical protein CQ06_08975 [Ralstonia solanacearum]
MATVLGLDRLAVRAGGHARLGNWLALIVACVLSLGTAQAQSNGLDLTVKQSGPSVPQTPSGNVMSVLVPITIGVVAVGAAAVALPATGALAITGDVIAAAGSSAIRKGVINGAALAGIVALIGAPSGISLDSGGSMVAPAVSANAGDAGFNGFGWGYSYNTSVSGGSYGNGVAASPGAACAAMLAADAYLASNNAKLAGIRPTGTSYECHFTNDGGSNFYSGVGPTGSCISGYVASGSSCVPDQSGPKQAATDAQIQSAIKAAPASWPSVYNNAGCPSVNTMTNVVGSGSNDPCAQMIGAPSTGYGVSFPSGNTVAGTPKTDTQTKVNADGTKTTTNTTTNTTTTLTGTQDRVNPVEGTTTTSTSVSTTTTNPDGSTTTTTTTTTDQAPPATASNPANEQQQSTTATFAAPDTSLYKPKDKTFEQVLKGFVTRVQAMAWYTAMSGFFNVSIGAGSCPSNWVVPATQWNPALDMTPYVCSSSMMTMYQLGGVVVLMVAAWAAFRIAFL